MDVESFYSSLQVLEDFAEVAEPEHYTSIPKDWSVAVADVRDSTGAIERGLYKAVNVVGASVITAVLNALESERAPYMFAGDGAALCVPGTHTKAVAQALAGTRRMARERYGLRLCVGLVPMHLLLEQRRMVKVALYRLSEAIEQPIFMGGGLYAAEELVKQDPDGPYGISEKTEVDVDFSGLECRWNHVPSRKDEIVSLLVRATGPTMEDRARVYEEVIGVLRDTYGDEEDRRPILHEQLRLTISPRKLSVEQKLQTWSQGLLSEASYWAQLVVETLLGMLFMRWELSTSKTEWGQYKEDVEAHTDFEKMDGALRQVVAGTEEQRATLESYLQEQYEQGRLIYGHSSSDAAMITCLVFRRDKEHVHFVDGANGGYAKAARALKARESALQHRSS